MINAVTKRLIGVPDPIAVRQSNQSEASGAITSPKATQTLPLVPISRQRLATYTHWEKLHRGHKESQRLELGLEGIRRVLQLLVPLQQQLQQQPQRESLISRLQQHLIDWQQQHGLQHGIDHRLQIFSAEASPRQFRLPSVDLLSKRKHDEVVTIRALGKQQAVLLPQGANSQRLKQELSRAFAQFDIKLLVTNGASLFEASESIWQALGGELSVQGQGQRLPAGELRPLRLKEHFHQQDPRSWKLGNVDHQQLVANAINMLTEQQRRLLHKQSALVEQLIGKDFQVDYQALEQQLLQLKQQLDPQTYAEQLAALMAQANLSRLQSQALILPK
ncbi:hypothetical protein [Ferrimonas lipolytica]|uniref:Uncharacterized protein n=1 Tax=Ferrimonas lipolytica TaxID=2724191 RepID=A0A6H1UDS8_9GAMM|nr:hypothetical protein [Ferrimonas lipolytica]QIZ76779.1 hypothetical protein HER31_07765 [Ferrimonas lipolytica]